MPEWKQRRTAQETFDVYAPLAHRLGVQQVRWQLEDLAFATLHPKRYAEIEQMVAARAPEREEYLARVLVAVRERLAAVGHRGRGDRPAQAPVEHLREDGGPGQGVRRHPRPGGHPGRGRRREGLLGGPGRHPRHLAAGPGPVQGLHQHPEVQPLPVAAHHGDRARRQAHRGPGPHPRDAPPGRVRHRRPLGVQGEGGRLLGDGLDAADRRRRPGDHRPGRVPRGAQARPASRTRSTSSPPRAGSSPCRRARPRSTSPTPSTPRSATAASGPGSTAAWCRSTPACPRPTPSRSSPPRRPRPGPRGTGCRSWPPRGPATRSASGSAGSGGRTPSRTGARSWPRPCGARACRCRR